ncbi:MAG TPA: zinc ribbon domain-containing protein [Anaeromyxobacteraceae bacterium]|nr:zinc ribbon domain-containing protein [Anaeromyxobacteraceae bacterium]
MPIYEYACDACGKSFEELIIRRSDEAEVACPACRGRKVSRLLSRTASPRSGGGGSAGASCGPVG